MQDITNQTKLDELGIKPLFELGSEGQLFWQFLYFNVWYDGNGAAELTATLDSLLNDVYAQEAK